MCRSLEKKDKILKIIDKIAFFFFVVLIFFLPISNAIIESSCGFIFLILLVRSIIEKPNLSKIKVFFSERINLYLLIFFIAVGVSVFVSSLLWRQSLKTLITKWGEGVLLFYAARIFLNKKQIKILCLIMVFSVCLLSVDGIYQKITGVDFIRTRMALKTKFATAITGTFRHYNDFATFLGTGFFITIGFFGYARKLWQKMFLSLTLSAAFINIFFTFSRGAWFALMTVSLLAIIFIKNNKTKIILLLLLLSFFGVLLSFLPFRDRLFMIFQPGGDASRFKIWRLSWAMFLESPFFGKGVGTFIAHFPEQINLNVQYTHNCYLQILTETGLLGFISFFWFLGEVLGREYKRLKENTDGLSFGLFFGLLTFLTHSFFDTQLFSLKLSILFWLLISFSTIYLVPFDQSKKLWKE